MTDTPQLLLAHHLKAIYDPGASSADGYLSAIEAGAPSFGVRLSRSAVRNAADIERAVSEFAAESNGGLIVQPGSVVAIHRELIVALAARHHLPAAHAYRYFVTIGGLKFAGTYASMWVECFNWTVTADQTKLRCANKLHWLVRDNTPTSWPTANFMASRAPNLCLGPAVFALCCGAGMLRSSAPPASARKDHWVLCVPHQDR